MLINQEELQKWSGYERAADIKKWLTKHKIKWLPTRDGQVCTTLAWIEESKEERSRIAEL